MSPKTLISALRKCAALEACLENDSNGVPCRREVMAGRLSDKIERRLLYLIIIDDDVIRSNEEQNKMAKKYNWEEFETFPPHSKYYYEGKK